MKKRFKQAMAMGVAVGLTVTGTACTNSDSTSEPSAASGASSSSTGQTASVGASLSPVTLKIMLFGEKPIDMDKVMAEYETRSKDAIDTKLNIEWNPAADHKQKLGLRMASGEQVDLAFDAPWMSLTPNVNQGFYQELDKYFNNDDYPGLKKAFPEQLIENNKINGHIYAIPIMSTLYELDVLYYRKDLAKKYGMDPIDNLDDFSAYLDKVKEDQPNMIPLALGRGFMHLFENEDKKTRERGINSTDGFTVVLSEDGKKVLGAVNLGDPESKFASLPAPFNSSDYFFGRFDKYVSWSKYLEKDVLVQKDAKGVFVAGKAASTEGGISDAASMEQRLQKAVPEAELGMLPYNTKVREKQTGAIGTDYKANNFLVVPATSKNVDRTMKFLDWIYSSQENHDLLENGIEGEHWIKDGDNGFKAGPSSTNYVFPTYELTSNMVMSRLNTGTLPEAVDYLNYAIRPGTYYELPLSKFVFDTNPVKTQLAKIKAKQDEYMPVLNNGLDSNWKQTAAKMNQELRSLGLEDVRAEVIKQVQAYLDAGGK